MTEIKQVQRLEKKFEKGKTDLEKFLETSKLRYFNKALRIEGVSPASKLFVYLGLIGLILFVLNVFGLILYAFCWFWTFFIIILSGYIFCSPDKKYNMILVLSIFLMLVFIPTIYGQSLLNLFSLEFQAEAREGITQVLSRMGRNNFNIYDLSRNIAHIMNWIIFLTVAWMSGAVIINGLSLNLVELGKNAAMIGIAIVVLTTIYGIFALAGVGMPTVWETVGASWNAVLHIIGLAQLDQTGNIITNTQTVVNGIYSNLPLIVIVFMFVFAFHFRNKDLKSILFARRLTKEEFIKVERTKPSMILAGVIILIMSVYVAGYFLITAEPTIVVNPIITLAFFMIAGLILFFIGMKILILNQRTTFWRFIANSLKWFFFGMAGLWLWFGMFQNYAYQLGMTDSYALTTLSLNSMFFENQLLEQLFLVAMPETLIFQIAFIGFGNRIYFYFTRSRVAEMIEKGYKIELDSLKMDYLDKKSGVLKGSVSMANQRRMAKAVYLRQQIDTLESKIHIGQVQEVPKSIFIIPSLLSSILSSFFFSWYHSFRRGIDFIEWWQNPMLGMVYFGAGFFLCLITMFAYFSAIGVHWANNIMSLMLG